MRFGNHAALPHFSRGPRPSGSLNQGLKSTQKSPLTLPSISGFRTNCDKFGSAHSSLQVTVVVALSEIQVPYSIE